jgi:hypothetical protein
MYCGDPSSILLQSQWDFRRRKSFETLCLRVIRFSLFGVTRTVTHIYVHLWNCICWRTHGVRPTHSRRKLKTNLMSGLNVAQYWAIFIELLCIKQACWCNITDLNLSPVCYRQTKLTGSIFICRWHWHFNFTWYCANNTGSRLRHCAELSLVVLCAPLLQHFRKTHAFAHLVAIFMHNKYTALARLWNLD